MQSFYALHRSGKKYKKPVAFLSDSTRKVVVEDDTTQVPYFTKSSTTSL